MNRKLLFIVGVIIYMALIWWLAQFAHIEENYMLGELELKKLLLS